DAGIVDALDIVLQHHGADRGVIRAVAGLGIAHANPLDGLQGAIADRRVVDTCDIRGEREVAEYDVAGDATGTATNRECINGDDRSLRPGRRSHKLNANTSGVIQY